MKKPHLIFTVVSCLSLLAGVPRLEAQIVSTMISQAGAEAEVTSPEETFQASPITTAAGGTTTITASEVTGDTYDPMFATTNFTGTSSSKLTYSFSPTGIAITANDTDTLTQVIPGMNPTQRGTAESSSLIQATFYVATTGQYVLSAGSAYGGDVTGDRLSPVNTVFNYQLVLTGADGSSFVDDPNGVIVSTTPTTPASVDETVTLQANVEYFLLVTDGLDPSLGAADGPGATKTVTGQTYFSLTSASIPEPSCLWLLALGLPALILRCRRMN